MKTKFLSHSILHTHWPVFVLAVVNLALFVTNYEFGTWFLGWDNTVPELNPWLNLNRIVFGVWQGYRGLGTLDGMAHTANIVYWVYASGLSLVLPTSLVRYVSQILMHFLGGVGMYALVRSLVLPWLYQGHHRDESANTSFAWVGLLAALLYQLNLMTIQMFFIPLELFSLHFVALPWATLTTIRYLQTPSKKTLRWVALVQLATVSQAHVPSVFISFAWQQACILLPFWLAKPVKRFKPLLVLGLLLISLHSFWGVPYIYSALHKSPEIAASRINQFSTNDIFLRNQAWGDLNSVVTFGGFNLDYLDWNSQTLEFGPMMGPWVAWHGSGWFQVLAYTVFLFGLLGVGVLMVRSLNPKQDRWLGWGLVLSFGFSLTMLAVDTPVLGWLAGFLRSYVPFFADIFRFTFTKFSLWYVFSLSVLVAAGVEFGLGRLGKLPRIGTWSVRLLGAAGSLAVLFMAGPAFAGWFWYPELRVSLPSEYAETASFFKEQPPHARTVILPMPGFYGWTTNTWGHRGSGFLWQWLPQPLIDRSFDPWSKYNESLYLQLDLALKTNNQELFSTVLEQHAVQFVLIDTSIFNPGGFEEALLIERAQAWLETDTISQLAYANSLHQVYERETTQNNNVFGVVQPRLLDLAYHPEKTSFNPVLADATSTLSRGSFSNSTVSDPSGDVYPFAQLLSGQKQPSSVAETEITFTALQPANTELDLPPFSFEEPVMSDLYVEGTDTSVLLVVSPLLPNINNQLSPTLDQSIDLELSPNQAYFVQLGDNLLYIPELSSGERRYVGTVQFRLDRIQVAEVYSAEPRSSADITPILANQEAAECWKRTDRDWSVDKTVSARGITLISENASACVILPLTLTNNDRVNLVGLGFEYQSATGQTPNVCVRRKDSFECLNQEPGYAPATQVPENTLITVLIEDNTKYTVDFVNRVSQLDQSVDITYNNLLLLSFESLGSTFIDTSQIANTYQEYLQRVESNTSERDVTVSFPTGENNSITTDLSDSSLWLYQTAVSCGHFTDGSIRKHVDPLNNRVMYTTEGNTLLCDATTHPNLKTDSSYLLQVTGEATGLAGTKAFVFNPNTNQRDAEFVLTGNRFEEWVPILPSKSDQKTDQTNSVSPPNYTVNLSLQSFGRETNNLTLEQLRFYQLPVSWLSQITFRTPQLEPLEEVSVENPQRFGSFVAVNVSAASEGLVVLNESYDPGWLAWSAETGFIQGVDHRVFNGWANSWLVPRGEYRLYFFYWPQLLSFGGYLVLIGVVCVLVLKKSGAKSKPKVKKDPITSASSINSQIRSIFHR